MNFSFGQCPVNSFTVPPTLCVEEQFDILNTSSGAVTYEWDFCLGDINETPSASLETNSVSAAYRPELIPDNGNNFLFVTSRTGGISSLHRIEYGSDLTDSPIQIIDLNLGLSELLSIEIIKHGSNWHGFLLSFNGNLYRLDFGIDITNNNPTVTEITSVQSSLSSPLDLVYLNQDGEHFFLVNSFNSNDLTKIDFGNNPLDLNPGVNLITIGSVTTLSGGLSTMKICDSWYVLATSRSNNSVLQLNFGTDVKNNNSPGVSVIDTNPLTMQLPQGIATVSEGGNFHSIIQANSGDIYRLSHGTSFTGVAPGENLGNLGMTNTRWGLSLHKNGGDWVGYSAKNAGADLTKLTFSRDCGSIEETSTLENPEPLSYSSSGSYAIGLKTKDADDNTAYLGQSIVVTNDVAPSASFLIDENICISTPNTFTPSILGLTYTWDFGDGSMPAYINDDVPTHQYSLPGTYTVRLDVNDGMCDNFTEQEITIYPVLPIPTFTAPATECKNTLVSFTSTTDSSQHLGVLTYEWDFNGEGASTDQDPTFTFTTPGTKQITLKTLIPGCENTSSIFEIEIADGPTSAFNPSSFSICEGETISFTDVSTNSPIMWSWDFDDGFTSTTQNPNHLFSTAGIHNVALTVTDALGCENTLVQEVSVSALPVVSFDFNVPCTSADGIQFMDFSTVSGGTIVSRTWYIGDTPLAEAQNQQNPLLSFAAEGTVNVRLETVSSGGCEASHSEDIQILASPQPEFSMNIGCQGEESLFTDLSVSPGNQVTSWLWRLDGAEYATEDINHTFSGAGMFDVTLEVTGQNFCSETITKSIEVLELLTVDFDVNGDCSNELVELADQSVILQDPIVSRAWSLNGNPVGNGAELVLESLPDNTYDIMLEVTTASGCVVNTTSSLVINQSPESSISAQKTFGVPGDVITFTNQSTGGSSYHWLFNGVSVSDNAVEETFTFPDAGTYQVSMVSDNDLGCSDTTTTNVLIAVPSVDLSVGQFEIVGTGSVGTIFLEIQNNSNLPIDNTEVSVELENQFAITEQITSVIDVGESELVNLSIGVPLNVDQLSYLCVTLNSQYKGFDDNNPLDNEKCIAIQPKVVVEAPFPNPVRDQVRVRVVTPEVGSATLTLLNSAGKVEIEKSVQTQEGLNNFFVDLKILTTGIYFIRVQTGEITSVQRIIKL
ncbi:MAG: PKD domain-containing protein [Cyclobacteriaceae bacterium]